MEFDVGRTARYSPRRIGLAPCLRFSWFGQKPLRVADRVEQRLECARHRSANVRPPSVHSQQQQGRPPRISLSRHHESVAVEDGAQDERCRSGTILPPIAKSAATVSPPCPYTTHSKVEWTAAANCFQVSPPYPVVEPKCSGSLGFFVSSAMWLSCPSIETFSQFLFSSEFSLAIAGLPRHDPARLYGCSS
jgi:hypothetical protein